MASQDLIHGYTTPSKIRRRAAANQQAAATATHPLVNLQRKIGNAEVARMLAQRQDTGEEEEEVAMKRDPALQRAAEEEELATKRDPSLQRAAEEEELAMKRDPSLQRAAEEEEQVAMKRDPSIQRHAATEEIATKRDPALQRAAEEEELAMKRDPAVDREVTPEVGMAGGPISADLSSRIESRRGGGAGLDEGTRQSMESSFDADFSGVRVHTDAESDTLNRSVGAKAFTIGSDIFFSRSASPSDSQLLAHELTHVVQQGGAGGASGPLTVSAADDATEAQADAMASSVTSGAATAQAARKVDEKTR